MEQFIIFCNENDGFIMGLLTFVYVVATIFICHYNYRSAEEAKKQVEASNLIQKQNIDIQLFSMRKKLILELKEELVKKSQYVTKCLFVADYQEKYEEKVINLLAEIPDLFKKEDFEFVYQANDCMNDVISSLRKYSTEYSGFVFINYKDDYENKLKKFRDSTKDFLNSVIDEENYRNICKSCDTGEMCDCLIEANKKYLEAFEILNKNDIENIFRTKYLSFK